MGIYKMKSSPLEVLLYSVSLAIPWFLEGNVPTGKEDSELFPSLLTATERHRMTGKLEILVKLRFYALVIGIILLKRAFSLCNSDCWPKVWGWIEVIASDGGRNSRHVPAQVNGSVGSPLMSSSHWIVWVIESPVKILPCPSQLTSINRKFFSLVGRMREGLFSSSTSHKPADHPVLHDANDGNAPVNQQRGYWIYPGCADSREKRRRCQKAFSRSDRGLQR